eukprot:7376226-Prymnesium_polylepis.3
MRSRLRQCGTGHMLGKLKLVSKVGTRPRSSPARRTCNSVSPKCSTIANASRCCCFGLACISNDRITGNFEKRNAHSPTASATQANGTTVQNVCLNTCHFTAISCRNQLCLHLEWVCSPVSDDWLLRSAVPAINLTRWVAHGKAQRDGAGADRVSMGERF